jgi:hypothetical protein
VDDGLLPPFGEPPGPPGDDETVLRAFVRGEQPGHSSRFHVEGRVLVASPAMAAAMRVTPDTFLVRLDVPPGMEDIRTTVQETLTNEGLRLLDEETLFAMPVAVQWLGIRASSWDLWGRDLDQGFADLRAAAGGDPLMAEGPPPPFGPPPS